MVNLKTKSHKHENDNEKRRQSIKEREKAKLSQSQIIKNALSNSTLNNSGKKIVFSDEENDVDTAGSENNNLEFIKKNFNEKKKPTLFNSSESENEDYEIREKTQFKGKKGFELLNLQSTYGNDERFKIDERFLEDENDELEEDKNEVQKSEDSPSDEKIKQLKILGSILGTSVPEPEEEKKSKKRTYEMIRYDASKKEHEVYEIKTPSNTGSHISHKQISTKKNEDRKKQRINDEDSPRPKVSKEKFYEVSNEIKNKFKSKQENGQFSLLQTYGMDKGEEIEDAKIESEEETDFEYEEPVEINNEPNRVQQEVNEKGVVAKGIWKESFFFSKDDDRFKEALEFINKKDSPEAIEAAENYDKNRRKLKEILRLHLKKQMHKRDPFKNKIGGMNKKQLASSKFKNSKMTFNKRKSNKKNSGGKV